MGSGHILGSLLSMARPLQEGMGMNSNKTVAFQPLYLNRGVQSLAIGDGKIVRLAADPSGKGLIQVWYEVEIGQLGYVLEETEFAAITAGESIGGEFEHIGWAFFPNGTTVHVYKKRQDAEPEEPEIYQDEHTVALPPEMEESQS